MMAEIFYLVFHAKIEEGKANFMEIQSEDKTFDLVGKVLSEDVNEVYKLSNHIDRDWRANDRAVGFTRSPRSTSVGDILVKIHVTGGEMGRNFRITAQKAVVVAGMGFKELDLDYWVKTLKIEEDFASIFGKRLEFSTREESYIYKEDRPW